MCFLEDVELEGYIKNKVRRKSERSGRMAEKREKKKKRLDKKKQLCKFCGVTNPKRASSNMEKY